MKYFGGPRQGGSTRRFGRPVVSSQHRSNCRGVAWFMVLGLLIMALAPRNVRAAGSPLVAYLKNNNVFFIPAAGGSATAVTTRGTNNPDGISYPWYQWSPSGRFLLLMRGHGQDHAYDLLLINRQGDIVRTLLRNMGQASFYPSWAIDADIIAFSFSSATSLAHPMIEVRQVDLYGRTSFLWLAKSGDPCDGGGPGDPSQELAYTESLPIEGASWSVNQHLAVYRSSFCSGSLNLTDFSTGTTRYLGNSETSWYTPALSSNGSFAASIATLTGTTFRKAVVVADVRTGAIRERLGAGTLPFWSPDFRHLYYEEQQVSHPLRFKPDYMASSSMISTIWSVTPSGTERTILLRQAVYGYGRIQPTPDGRSLIFSSVDNCDILWQHRLPGDTFDANLLKLYGPHVRVQKLDIGEALHTLAVDGGTPVVG